MVEPVESTQESQESTQDPQPKNSKLKTNGSLFSRMTPWLIALAGTLEALGVSDFLPELVLRNTESESPQIESQTETVESTEPYSAVFKTRDGDGKEPEEVEKLQLSFKNGNVQGSSEAEVEVDGIKKEWAYSGYEDGNYLALSYKGKNTSTLGTVLMEQVAEGKYVGYWEGKLCSDSSIIIRCPYILVKGNLKRNNDSLVPKQISHLTKSCSGTDFNADTDETLAKNPCS